MHKLLNKMHSLCNLCGASAVWLRLVSFLNMFSPVRELSAAGRYRTVKFLFAADVAGKLFVYCKLKILSNCPARGTVGQLGLVCTQFFLHYPKRLPAIIWLHGT